MTFYAYRASREGTFSVGSFTIGKNAVAIPDDLAAYLKNEETVEVYEVKDEPVASEDAADDKGDDKSDDSPPADSDSPLDTTAKSTSNLKGK